MHRPRLRRPGERGKKFPAYEAMQEGEGLGARMLDILLRGVSTRQYQRVLPEMLTVGVSRSTVSRETMEAAAAELERLLNRRFEEVELLILYIDGMVFGDHHVIAAVGVDAEGHKHVLGIQEGATENAAAPGLAGRFSARGAAGPETAVCDRRLEGLAGGDPRRVRGRAAGAALPRPQVAQRPACRSQSGTRCGRRCGPPGGWIRRPAGPSWRSWPNGWRPLSGRRPACGRVWRNVSPSTGFAASLSGHHQSHRESAGGSEVANSPGAAGGMRPWSSAGSPPASWPRRKTSAA